MFKCVYLNIFMKNYLTKIKHQLFRKDSLKLQILKYFLCGGLAVFVDQIVYYSLGLHLIPIFTSSDPIVEFLGISITSVDYEYQSRNLWIVKIICWILANTTVYLMNRAFVFTSGKHNIFKEIILFYTFSLPQFVFIALIDILVKFGWEVTYSNYSMLLLAGFVNFVIRKFIIFKG